MNPSLRVFRRLRHLQLFIVLTIAHESFAQSPAPELVIRQGLPAFNDHFVQFHFGGGKFLACTQEPAEFFTSKDGDNWSRIPGPDLGDPYTSYANAVQIPHFTYGLGRWVVISYGGQIFSSPDLVNWTQSTTGTNANLNAIDFRDSSFYVAGDSATLLSSTDGITWTRDSVPKSSTQESFSQVAKGNGWLVVSSVNNSSGLTFLYRSHHAAGPWKQDTVTNNGGPVKFVNGLFYQYEPGGYASTDAHTWTPLTGTNGYNDVFADSSTVYVVAYPGTIASSYDGINFNPPANLPLGALYGYYGHGHYFVWYINSAVATDTAHFSVLGAYGPTAASNGRNFVKVSPNFAQSIISSSTDFTNWKPRDTVTAMVSPVLYDSSRYLATGPVVYTSTNGTGWSSAGNGSLIYNNGNFNCIYGGGTYVAWWVETPNNYVWFSHDGINWGGSALPPPTEQEFFDGYNSAVTEISNIQYVNGRFWLMNSADGGTPAAVFVSSNGQNFDTSGFNNTWANNLNVYSYDQLVYVPDSGKYYIFGTAVQQFSRATFFSASTTNPLDSTIVVQNNTTLTGNVAGAFLYDGEDISYNVPGFVDPGGYHFVYSNGHWVGSVSGPGNPYDPNQPAFSYLLWSSDGATWNGSRLDNYAKVLSNIAAGDTFRIEGWNNYEMIATFASAAVRQDSVLQFTAAASSDNSSALLTWRMSADSVVRKFVIERSTSNSGWMPLDSVPADGGNVYHYTDAAVVPGIDDYRLTLVYNDTSLRLSPVRRVPIAEPQHIAVFPNPVRDQALLISDPAITGMVTVYTESGTPLRIQVWNGTQVTVSMAGLPAGTYHIVVRREDGMTYDRHVLHIN